MKKIVVFSVVVVATLTLSGCGDSVKSVEEYSKLSKTELDSMYKECKEKLDNINLFDENDLKKIEEIEDIDEKISKSRGSGGKKPGKSYLGFVGYGLVTDDELKKFGNSRYAEFVECGRIQIAKMGGMEVINKPRKSIAEKYKNVGK